MCNFAYLSMKTRSSNNYYRGSFCVKSPPPKRGEILAATFNGGGIHTIVATVMILLKIQHLVRIAGKPKFTWDHSFHLLAGSGTGGLLAILIGRLRVPLEDILDMFQNLSTRRIGKEKCGAKDLEDVLLENALVREGMGKKFFAEDSNGIPVFVVDDRFKIFRRTRRGKRWPELLRSYKYQGDCLDDTTTITEALRMTSNSATSHPLRNILNRLRRGLLQATRALKYSNSSGIVVHEAIWYYGIRIRFNLLLSVGVEIQDRYRKYRDMPMHGHCDDVAKLFASPREDYGTFVHLHIPGLEVFEPEDHTAVPKVMEITKDFLMSEACKEALDTAVKAILSAPL